MGKYILIFSLGLMVASVSSCFAGVTTITTNKTITNVDNYSGWSNRVELRGNPIVNMIGGYSDFIHLYDTSTLNSSGGKIGICRSYGSSKINLKAGSNNNNVIGYDYSQIVMTGGQVGSLIGYGYSNITVENGQIESARADSSSSLYFKGGTVQNVIGKGSGVFHILGGTAGTVSTVSTYNEIGELMAPGYVKIGNGQITSVFGRDKGKIDISGGNITELGLYDMSIVNITDGSVDRVFTEYGGTVNLYGGEIGNIAWTNPILPSDELGITSLSDDLEAIDGVFYLHGNSLMATNIGGLYGYGYASGFWDDGNSFYIDFENADTFSHVILVPEPATMFLLALGGLMLRRKK